MSRCARRLLLLALCAAGAALAAEAQLPANAGTPQGAQRRSPEELVELFPDESKMASAYVELDSWIYPAVDRLAALGYAPSAISGMRPWTRLECMRVLREAEALIRYEGTEPQPALSIVRALREEFAAEMQMMDASRWRGAALDSVYARFTGISGRPLTDGYHFGQTITNDFGRPFEQGANAYLGLQARAHAGRFAAFFRGEFQHAGFIVPPPKPVQDAISLIDLESVQALPPLRPRDINRFKALEAYATANVAGFAISFGKQSVWWGPGASGAMTFSNNAEPLPMLRVSRVSPRRLPLFLKYLGPMRVETFWAQLAGHNFIRTRGQGTQPLYFAPIRPRPYIHGEKISFKPTENFEFGFSSTTIFGGSAYPLTVRSFLRSYGVSNTVPGAVGDPGDRRSGFDLKYRLPFVRDHVTFYLDSFAEDEISPVAFPRRSALQPGLYFPRLPGLTKVDLRAEGFYTDLPGLRGTGFFYYNFRFVNGYTHQNQLLGHWVGRQGSGFQLASTYWHGPRQTVELSYRRQRVNPDFLKGGGLHDVRVSTGWALRNDVTVGGTLQYERWRFPLISAAKESNVAATFRVEFRPQAGKR